MPWCHVSQTTLVTTPAKGRVSKLQCREETGNFICLGINLFVLEMFQQFSEILGSSAPDPTVPKRTLDPLLNASDWETEHASRDTLLTNVLRLEESGEALELDVQVTNYAGHKFPTGAAIRRAFIELTVLDEAGEVLWSSGTTNSLGVLLDGASGEELASEWTEEPAESQPHYTLIDRQDQVQIYEERTLDEEGKLQSSVLGIAGEHKDNRIVPAGWVTEARDGTGTFQKDRRFPNPGSINMFAIHPRLPLATPTPSPNVGFRGMAVPEYCADPENGQGYDPYYCDPEFTQYGADIITYRMPLKEIEGWACVQARVLYQSNPPYYLKERLHSDDGKLLPAAERLAFDYSCGRCHNDVREDPVLIDQDPDARYEFIRTNYPDDDYRTSRIKMVQGNTMWGGVNRVRFYNGLFSFFDSICVPIETTLYRSPDDPRGENYEVVDCGGTRFAPCTPGCRQLDVGSFRDAVQTCGRYCGVGRFMEDWEVDGLLTHFWDQQAKLEDVIDSLNNQLATLQPDQAQEIATVTWKRDQLEAWQANLQDPPPIAGCQALSTSYLLTSCESLRDDSPIDPDNQACSRDWTAPRKPSDVASVEDPEDLPAMIRHLLGKGPELPERPPQKARQSTFLPFVSDQGLADAIPATDPLRRGKDLYELSCGRCHGASPEGQPQVGGRGHRFLVGSSYVFFKLIEDGLTPSNPIPPNPQDPSQESLYMPEFTLQRLSCDQAATRGRGSITKQLLRASNRTSPSVR